MTSTAIPREALGKYLQSLQADPADLNGTDTDPDSNAPSRAIAVETEHQ